PAGGLRFAHDGIPFCLLPGLEDRYDDLKTHDYATMVEIGEPDFFPVDDKNKVQPAPCHGCALRGACPGLYVGYHEAFGDLELRPVTGRPRSNSFNYVFERLVTTAAGDRCPLRDDGVSPWDRGRHLFVKNGERIARFRTDSRDFADVEIEAVKHDVGQLYLDVSTKAAPDDFASDLLKMTRSRLCEPCPERAHCTGLFEPVPDDVFARDDARVRDLLATLRGGVLDVGCGEGPYDDVLEPLARDGAIRYVGIDPDERRLAAQRQRRSWAALYAAEAESFVPDGDRSFDHVMVLRSWNHLRDPHRAVANLLSRLRVGGTFTVVDNVAFGLARTPAQARRAKSSPAGFEHYRNDGSAEAHDLLVAAGLRLLERRDVGPSTSNQWLLHLDKPNDPTGTRQSTKIVS
ncbi:MAG: uncharacterized protein JWM53_623, partial [bacterium]|nr:uncharacterized protein [bacterium]